MGVRLPSEYQEVEWIGTTGTQIIDTDYLPVDGDEMSIEFSFTSFPGSKNYYCLAATDNSDPQVQFVFGNDSGSRTLFYKYFSTGSAKMLKTSFAVNTIYRIDVASNGDCTCNGVTVSPVNNLGYATGHMRFFARMAGNINFIGRLYTFVASHSGTEKVNLVPCYRKADDKPGMYDLVTKQFFTNAGTGEFTVGPDVIDSISPWLVARRRMLMYKEPELYPVGTHILSMYIGDKDSGARRNFESGYGINTSTGEYYATGSGNTYASDVYVPVNPKYTYQKNGNRLNTWCFYDKDKQYISKAPSYNNLNAQTLAKFPANVRYVRIQPYNFANQAIEITRIA